MIDVRAAEARSRLIARLEAMEKRYPPKVALLSATSKRAIARAVA